jgi:hypothetical protein
MKLSVLLEAVHRLGFRDKIHALLLCFFPQRDELVEAGEFSVRQVSLEYRLSRMPPSRYLVAVFRDDRGGFADK